MTEPQARAVIRLPGEGRAIDMGAFRMTAKAEVTDTAGAFTLLEADEPAGFGPPMHVHDDAGEAFYVLSGEYLIFVDDDETLCPAGSFVFIPAGVTHGFRVGRMQSRKLNFYVPGAMVGYFDDLAAAIGTGGVVDPDELVAIAARHSMQVLGPVPEGYV